MRYSLVAAGLVAVAYADAAGKAAETVTKDVTVTSCDATKTDCVYWGDWATDSTSSAATTTTSKSKDCGSTTSTSTGTVTYTKKEGGEVVTKTFTAVVTKAKECDSSTTTDGADGEGWGDAYISTTDAASTTKNCGTTTSTSTGKVTFTKKEGGEVVTKDITAVVTKTIACSASTVTGSAYTDGGEWEDADVETDGCGTTTAYETKTDAVTFTIPDGKVITKTITSTITKTGVPASCTSSKASTTTKSGSKTTATDGEYEGGWGEWVTDADCGATTKTVTEKSTATYGDKTIVKDVTKTVTEVPASCTADNGNNNGGKNNGGNGGNGGDNDDGDNNGGNGGNGGWGKGGKGADSDADSDDCGPVTKTKVYTSTATYGEKTVTKEVTEVVTETPASCSTVDGADNGGWGNGGNGGNGGYGDKSTAVAPVTLTSTAACGSYTGTGAPSWFAYLPTDVASSIGAKWTAGAPADWCYYTYSTGAVAGPTGSAGNKDGAKSSAKSTAVDADGASATKTGAWAQYTGAANANTGSMAFAGLAALAAAIMA